MPISKSPEAASLERFDYREVLSAAPDFMAQSLSGEPPGKTSHPLAHQLDLQTVAHAYGKASARPGRADAPHAIVEQGLSSAGFLELFRDAASLVVRRAYDAAASQFAFAARLQLTNTVGKALHNFDKDWTLARSVEGAPLQRHRLLASQAGSAQAAVQRYGVIFDLTGDELLSVDPGALNRQLLAIGTMAAELEFRLLADAIEAPVDLSDGAVFDSSNTVAQPLDADSLAAAVGMLRNQGAAGCPLNIAPRHVVVEPDLELLARKLIRDADMSAHIQVSVLPGLAAGRWVLLGSPDLSPTLTICKFGDEVTLRTERNFNTSGISIRPSAYVGATIAGRVGIVRGGA